MLTADHPAWSVVSLGSEMAWPGACTVRRPQDWGMRGATKVEPKGRQRRVLASFSKVVGMRCISAGAVLP